MSFRDNLQHLRDTRNMTQSELAMLVASAAVGGEVGGREKLPRDGQAHQAVRPVRVLARRPRARRLNRQRDGERGDRGGRASSAATPVDKDGYDEHMRRRAWDVAAGVAVIVMSFGVAMFVTGGGYNSATVSASIIVHLVGIALGLCFFVPTYRSHAAFRKEHPVVEDCYTPEEKAEARRRKLFGVGGGVALLVLGMFMPGMLQSIQMFSFVPLWLFACFAAAAALLVHSVMMDRRVDVSFYNGAPISRSNPSFEGVVLTPDLVAQLVFGLNVGAAVGRS